jgi:hypothetical protein
VNGETTGPFARSELEEKAKVGDLTDKTMVWQQGMEAWVAAGTVEELAALIAANAPEKAAFDPATYVVGVWEVRNAQVPVPDVGIGTLDGSFTYNADATMIVAGTLKVTMNGAPMTITLNGSGSYRVEKRAEDGFIVYPSGNMTMIVPGYPPQASPLGDPIGYTVLGPDEVRDDEGTLATRRR